MAISCENVAKFPCHVYSRNSAGETLAHAAACHAKDGGVLKYLLELDPSLAHATDEDGETPLHCAARRFNREAIEALTAVDPKLINKKACFYLNFIGPSRLLLSNFK